MFIIRLLKELINIVRAQLSRNQPVAIRPRALGANGEPIPTLFIHIGTTSPEAKVTGIQRVVTELARNLSKAKEGFADVVLVKSNAHGLFVAQTPFEDSASEGVDLTARYATGELIAMVPGDYLLITEVVRPPYNPSAWQIDFLKNAGVKVGVIFYDLIPITHPDFFTLHQRVNYRLWKQLADRADILLSISEEVAKQLKERMARRASAKRQEVASFKLGSVFARVENSPTRTLPPAAPISFISIGTLEPRKNYRRLIALFHALWSVGANVNLTVVGRIGWKWQPIVKDFLKSPELGGRLRVVCDASDEDLATLYQNSDVLVTLSIDEGFGLPLVEASSFGLSIVASDIPVYREVVGDEGAYFITLDSSDQEIVKQILTWSANYSELKKRLKPPSPLTWEQSARDLAQKLRMA